MRYIFISDTHGEYQKMIDALNSVKFNPQVDTLVSLGDLFDRGPQSKEILEYVMNCPNRILLMGNHDLRLKEIVILEEMPNTADYSNGMLNTFYSLEENRPFTSIEIARAVLNDYPKTLLLLRKYLFECSQTYCLEWPDLIATHAWIPTDEVFNSKGKAINVYRPTWRAAAKNDWEEAVWSHSGICLANKIFPDKTLMVGHWHVNRFRDQLANRKSLYLETDDYSTLKVGDKLIAIDGCANLPYGKVNAYVYESDVEPVRYR